MGSRAYNDILCCHSIYLLQNTFMLMLMLQISLSQIPHSFCFCRSVSQTMNFILKSNKFNGRRTKNFSGTPVAIYALVRYHTCQRYKIVVVGWATFSYQFFIKFLHEQILEDDPRVKKCG